MGCVYCAANKVNGKLYIGKSTRSMAYRREIHERIARKGADLIFHRAIRKYGPDAFEWSILKDDLEPDELDLYEIAYIRKYNTKSPNGYNMTDGGDGGITTLGMKHSESAKLKCSVANKGRRKGKSWEEIFGADRAPVMRAKVSASLTGQKRHPLTDEVKAKISQSLMGNKITDAARTKLREKSRQSALNRSKVTEDDIRFIRAQPRTASVQRQLGHRFGLAPASIWFIQARKTFDYVSD